MAQVFERVFARQAKFSALSPVPLLGDEETPHEEVAAFSRLPS